MAASESHAALSTKCKRREKEIAALREAVANLKKGKKEGEVERSVQTKVTPVLAVSTQTDRRTYASVLAQTEEVSIGGENTDRMDIDTSPPPPKDKTTSLAGSPTGKPWNAAHTLVPTCRAFVLHGIARSGPWKQKIQQEETAFGRKGGGVIGVRWLLQGYRRRGKAFSSLVVFLKRAVATATDMHVRVRGRKHKVEEYLWDRRSTKLDGW